MKANAVLLTKATQAAIIVGATTGNPKKVRTATTDAVTPTETHITILHLMKVTPFAE
jgi:hypothetical protein